MGTNEKEELTLADTSSLSSIIKDPIPLQSICKIKNYFKPKESKSSGDEEDDEDTYDSDSSFYEDEDKEDGCLYKGRNSSHNCKPYNRQAYPCSKQGKIHAIESNNSQQKLENIWSKLQPGTGILENLPGTFVPQKISPNVALKSSPANTLFEPQTKVYKMTSSNQNSMALEIIIDGQRKNSSQKDICNQLLNALVNSKQFGETFLNINEDGMDAFTYAAINNMKEVVIQLKEIFFNYFTPADAITLLRRTDTHGNSLVHEVACIAGDDAVETLEEILKMRYDGKQLYDMWAKNKDGENAIQFCMLRSKEFPFKLIKVFHDFDPKILTAKDSKRKNILHMLIDTCNLRCNQNTSADAVKYGKFCLQFLLNFEIIKHVCILEKDNNDKIPLEHLKMVDIRPDILWRALLCLLEQSTKKQKEIIKKIETTKQIEATKWVETSKEILRTQMKTTKHMEATQVAITKCMEPETAKQMDTAKEMNTEKRIELSKNTESIESTIEKYLLEFESLTPNLPPSSEVLSPQNNYTNSSTIGSTETRCLMPTTTSYTNSLPLIPTFGSWTPELCSSSDVLSSQGIHTNSFTIESTQIRLPMPITSSYPISMASTSTFGLLSDTLLPQSFNTNSSTKRSTELRHPTSRIASYPSSMPLTTVEFGSMTPTLLPFSEAFSHNSAHMNSSTMNLMDAQHEIPTLTTFPISTPSTFRDESMTLPCSEVLSPQSFQINSLAIASTLSTTSPVAMPKLTSTPSSTIPLSTLPSFTTDKTSFPTQNSRFFSSISSNKSSSPSSCEFSITSEDTQILDDLSLMDIFDNTEMNNIRESEDNYYACFNKIMSSAGLLECNEVFQSIEALQCHSKQIHGTSASKSIRVDAASCLARRTKANLVDPASWMATCTMENLMDPASCLARSTKANLVDPASCLARSTKASFVDPASCLARSTKANLVDPVSCLTSSTNANLVDPASYLARSTKANLMDPATCLTSSTNANLMDAASCLARSTKANLVDPASCLARSTNANLVDPASWMATCTMENLMDPASCLARSTKANLVDPASCLARGTNASFVDPASCLARSTKANLVDPVSCLTSSTNANLVDPASYLARSTKANLMDPASCLARSTKVNIMEPASCLANLMDPVSCLTSSTNANLMDADSYLTRSSKVNLMDPASCLTSSTNANLVTYSTTLTPRNIRRK